MKFYERKIVIIFLPINLNMCLTCLIETVLLSTHNICFGWEIRKLIFSHTLLSGGLLCLFGFPHHLHFIKDLVKRLSVSETINIPTLNSIHYFSL